MDADKIKRIINHLHATVLLRSGDAARTSRETLVEHCLVYLRSSAVDNLDQIKTKGLSFNGANASASNLYKLAGRPAPRDTLIPVSHKKPNLSRRARKLE